ncbi:MAG: OadG family protein [Prevotella sp.]|nr:OadG family protein [Prevotella sp.]
MKRLSLTFALLLSCSMLMLGQGAKNIQINEVLTDNVTSIQDEFGNHQAWVELSNTAYSTYNVRGMYLTTDRSVLDNSLSAPARIAKMVLIPNNEKRTSLSARQHLLFFFNSNPSKGGLHLSLKVESGKPLWVALYDGNGVDLIDSVSVPVLPKDCSYARSHDGSSDWVIKAVDAVTPGIENFIQVEETKVAKIKREDPHGFGITVLSMGVVFSCLALLFIFFTLFGIYMKHKQAIKEAIDKQPLKTVTKMGGDVVDLGHKANVVLKDGLRTKGIDKEIYIAVISMALKQYMDDVHDVESGIITIRPKQTKWTRI